MARKRSKPDEPSVTAPRFGQRLEAASFVLLLALLVWAPFPYASNKPWSWTLACALVALLLLLLGASRLLVPAPTRLPAVVLLAGLTTVLVWAWAWLQTVPVAVLPFLPESAAAGVWSEPAVAALGAAPRLALDPAGGRDALMRLIAYAGTFWLAFVLCQKSERARRALTVLLVAMTLYAAYGLLNLFAGWDTVLWEEGPKIYSGYVTSTFINRNTYATYANLGIVIALGFLLEPALRRRPKTDGRRLALELIEQILGRRGLLILCLFVLSTASLLTGSRGGLLSAAVALAALALLCIALLRPRPLVFVPALAALGLIGWGLVSFSGEDTLERLDRTDDTMSGRTVIYDQAFGLIGQRPFLGWGYGSYPETYLLHRLPDFGEKNVDKAHDTYLEHALELGLPACALLYFGPVLLFGFALRGTFVRRKDQVLPLIGVTATVLVAVHSIVDFSLQVPAVALTFAAILGVSIAQSIPSSRPAGPGASLRD